MKKTILRTYKLKHSINIGKQKKILEILKEYRELSYDISNVVRVRTGEIDEEAL